MNAENYFELAKFKELQLILSTTRTQDHFTLDKWIHTPSWMTCSSVQY